MSADALAILLVVALAILLWLPRGAGPIDMRWDGAVYYILGTSLAEGRGYQLLNEPGRLDGVQYPPLLPAIVAAHQLVLGTSDPAEVGRWLRLSSFLVFLVYALVVLWFLRSRLPVGLAVLGTLLTVFSLHAWFLSDVLFPEVWFSVATLLFLMTARRDGRPRDGVLAYLSAVAAYALRTVGLVAFAVWVLDSVIRRRFRQAIVRAMLALLPVAAWQGYVFAVERSPAYTNPAYEYQRAPYLFYNVSYARNIALRDPITPEKGEARIVRRVARNALDLPMALGETFTASRRYYSMWLHGLLGDGPVLRPVIRWGTYLWLSLFGGLLTAGGVVILLWCRELLIPLYVLAYLAALALTPFPEQYMRYLMPIVPLAALCAIVLLMHVGRVVAPPSSPRAHALPFIVLVPALLVQVAVTVIVFTREHQRVAYRDARGEPLSHRLFFYDESQRGFDEAVDYLASHADSSHVIAAGTPHWMHLRTGLTAVMPPFEADPSRAAALLDGVPVDYLVIGRDVVGTERYTRPVVEQHPEAWQRIYETRTGGWEVFRRTARGVGLRTAH